jgi:hypothetical protein
MAAIGRRRQGDFSCALSAAHRLLLLALSVIRRERGQSGESVPLSLNLVVHYLPRFCEGLGRR